MTIKEIYKKYQNKIDAFDLELIIAHEIGKTREFVLAHPEYEILKFKIKNLKLKISRRRRGEPLAYILGQKEFFGLNFKVNKAVLIPRPETEILVEQVLQKFRVLGNKYKAVSIIDVGTGSGNIIISLACNMNHGAYNKIKFCGTDISRKALRVARYNAKKHKIHKKIEFINSDLLSNKKIFNNKTIRQCDNLIIIANLPYLSEKIYNATAPDVKKYEPRSALSSGKNGLDHYKKLFRQIKNTSYLIPATCYIEISPEQKPALENLAASILPDARLEFMKDLAGKWRVCKIVS